MKDIQFPVSYATFYRSIIYIQQSSWKVLLYFVNYDVFYVKSCIAVWKNTDLRYLSQWEHVLYTCFIYVYILRIENLKMRRDCACIIFVNNKILWNLQILVIKIVFAKHLYPWQLLHRVRSFFHNILPADVVTPLSRNLPGAFMALLWSSAWRRLIKPISRVLCKLSVP